MPDGPLTTPERIRAVTALEDATSRTLQITQSYGSFYPEVLRELALAEALEVLAAIDRTPNSLGGSAARDWARLDDRMNYVADFFRSRQQERSLLTSAPFTAEQVAAIHAGRVPAGRL